MGSLAQLYLPPLHVSQRISSTIGMDYMQTMAKNVTDNYYCYFDGTRQNLEQIYSESAGLHFCGEASIFGRDNVMKKWMALPATVHTLTSMDYAKIGDSIVVAVAVGTVKIGDGDPLKFTETFTICKEG